MLLEVDLGKRGCRTPWLGLALCFLIWLACAVAQARAETGTRVVVVLSDSAPTYREVADAFAVALAGKYPVQVRLLGDLGQDEIKALNGERILLVPVGVRALRGIHSVPGHHAQILSLLVPQASLLTLTEGGHDDSAVYIDQPPSRSLAFIKQLLPKAKRVGVVVSNDTAASLRPLAADAERARLELVAEVVEDREAVPRAVQRLLPQVEVLLLVPDANVVNEGSVRHLLIASYRQRIPVIGFSRGLANAGAVASLVSSPAEIGRQGGLLARQWNPLAGTLPAARHVGAFDLVFNRQVANSLAIEVPADEREIEAWRRKLD